LLGPCKQGGRKLVIAPDGVETTAPVRHRVDNAMVKALAQGFRWRKLLETGVYGTIEEIAEKEKINSSYVSRLLRTTLLAPDIVESILDGRAAAPTGCGGDEGVSGRVDEAGKRPLTELPSPTDVRSRAQRWHGQFQRLRGVLKAV
jgi:hypothetical protein